MTPPQPTRVPVDRAQQGSALLVTTLVLLLLTMLTLTSIKDAEQESTAGARSRATARTLYAADAGIQLALARLTDTPPILDAFSVSLADGASVQSRTRADTLPQDLRQVGLGQSAEGFSLNVGVGASSISRIYEVDVTAAYANSSATELQARLARLEVVATGY